MRVLSGLSAESGICIETGSREQAAGRSGRNAGREIDKGDNRFLVKFIT